MPVQTGSGFDFSNLERFGANMLEKFSRFPDSNHGWHAEWSGGFPNLCSGEWTLYHYGKKVDVEIPFQNEPANTCGEYQEWYFNGDWEEEWGYYEDGLFENEWIEENIEYLKKITKDQVQYPYIYLAFKYNDWRYGSCGGCI